MTDLVSVIVPVYNRERLILESLDSVYMSTYRPIEIVVIDDGSTDSSTAVVERWATHRRSRDFAVTLAWKNNGGPASARNVGYKKSGGRFILFLDSDDLIPQEMISAQVALLKSTGADYAYGKTRQVNRDGTVYATIGRELGDPIKAIPVHKWHLSSLVMSRGCVERAGEFNEEIMSEDWEFSCRVKARGGQGVFNPAIMTDYRIHDGPQLVKTSCRLYAPSRDIALLTVQDMLNGMADDVADARTGLAWLMFGNALRYLRQQDYYSYRSSMRHVLAWSGPTRLPLYAATHLVLSTYGLVARRILRR